MNVDLGKCVSEMIRNQDVYTGDDAEMKLSEHLVDPVSLSKSLSNRKESSEVWKAQLFQLIFYPIANPE